MSLRFRRNFNACVARFKVDCRFRNLSCYDQFLVTCLTQYASKNSNRDIEANLFVVKHNNHGISYAVTWNALAKETGNGTGVFDQDLI